MSALVALAARLRHRWPEGDATAPRPPEVLLEVVCDGGALRALEWLILLRYKPDLDVAFPDRALHSAAMIWRASVADVALRSLLLERMAAGLCGGGGLCDSMVEGFHTHRPLASVEPLLQEVFAGLMVLSSDPGALLGTLMSAGRTPAAMLTRIGLSSRLSVMPAMTSALPDALRSHPMAQSWLLESLAELPLSEQDEIAERILTDLSADERTGLGDLSWWLTEGYGRQRRGSRWRYLSEAAVASL